METARSLPYVARVDDSFGPSSILGIEVLGGFIAGTQPWARTARLQRVRADARLLPPGVEPHRTVHDNGVKHQLTQGDGWTLSTAHWANDTAHLLVTAASDQLAQQILAAATDGASEPKPTEDDKVAVGFWHKQPHGSRRVERVVEAEPWAAIRRNYTRGVAEAVDQLVATTAADVCGRLVLLHGPPGTGKTTLLRSLAQAWRDWCQLDFVLDPDRLFGDVGYLMDVLLDDEDDEDDKRWRMFVLEDCDELIRADAKQGAGQALSRLLNLTDGVVGQGLDVLICITTNEHLHRLHPAVTRAGRCLAQVNVGPLSRDEAVAWLGRSDGIGPAGATLAELYARQGRLTKVERTEPEGHVGLYL